MNQLVEFELEGGGSVIIESTRIESGSGPQRASSKGYRDPQKAKEKFEEVLHVLTPVANALQDRLQSLVKPADEVGVEFGLKLHGGAQFVIASAGAEANFKISLKWKRK